MEFSISKVTRAALLGTTALVAAGHNTGARADVTITANTTNTVSPLVSGDNITITNSGSVTGTFVGIQVLNPTNAGTILNQGTITVSSVGIQVTATGGVSGGLTNEGSIDGAFDGIQVFGLSSVGGGITNQSGGLISGASNAGINIGGTSTVLGGITNQGSIAGGSQGILVDNAAVNNGISNSGTIQGTGATGIGVTIGSTSTLTGGLTNSGLIQGNGSGNAISISGSTLTGGIANQTGGQIISPSNVAIVIAASSVTGGVSNQGSITGSRALAVSGSASLDTVDNSGLMSGAVHGIEINGPVSGGIDNSGTISGAASVGILVQLSAASVGGISNSGTISSPERGILVASQAQITGGIVNQAGGLISGGDDQGIQSRLSSTIEGGIDNGGTIFGGSEGISNWSGTFTGGILNRAGALISGGTSVGVTTRNTTLIGGIDNHGTISGGGNAGIYNFQSAQVEDGIINRAGALISAGTGAGISNFGSTIVGDVENGGTISGGQFGIENWSGASIEGGINNSGLINGGNVGLANVTSSTIEGGITNSGTISGVTGIVVDTSSPVVGGITNRGIITGTGGTSIQLSPADNILTLGSGSQLNGAVQAGVDDGDVLNLIEAGSEDDMLVGFEQLNMNGEEWTLTSDLTLVEGPSLFGDANINSGTLYMNGTLTAPAGVSAIGGTLAGSGNIVADVTVGSGGSIAPGNSIGVLNITGDVALGPGSFFDVEVEGSTADLLNVTGDVTIDPSSTVNVIPLGAGIDVVDQVIIDAGGTINANFQNIEPGGLIATTELRGTSQIILSAVSPVATDIGNQSGIEDSFAFQDALSAPGIGTFFVGPERRLWAKGIHEFNERDDSAEFAGFDQEIWGVIIGMDGLVTDDLRLGGALGYTDSDVEINMRSGDVDLQGLYAGLYGLYDKNAFHLSFGAQVGTQDKDLTRPVIVSGLTTNVIAETDGMSYGAHAKGGWDYGLTQSWTSRFNLNALYVHQDQDEYTDSANVTFGEINTNTFRFGPSVDVIGTFSNGSTTFTPRASLGYLQQWADGDETVDITFVNGTLLQGSLEDKDEGFATFGVGLDALFDNRVTAFVGYDGEYGDEETRNRITAGLRFGL